MELEIETLFASLLKSKQQGQCSSYQFFISSAGCHFAISIYLSLPRKTSERYPGSATAKIVTICLALVSSCANPLMYALRNPRFSIILRPNKRSKGKKRVQFYKEQENCESCIAKTPVSWAQRSICSVIYDGSRSDETHATSSTVLS